jgi:predicted nucleic acid-binding protein
LILVDTNVLSEPTKPVPNQRVMEWLRTNGSRLWLPSPVIAELRYGAEKLPQSRKRQKLEEFEAKVLRQYRERVVDFDVAAAQVHGVLRAKLRRMGKPVEAPDTYVAAIAISRNAAIATRNRAHFEHSGVALIDPWSA